jgi:carbonic anhydrase
MSCVNSQYTKILSNKENECKENCSFNFNYSNKSSCILTNKKSYLEITTDGKNNVTYNNQKLTLSDVRFYSPSLHTFDGKHTEGEIFLQHSVGGQNIIVSVPVVEKNGQSDSNLFFSKIAKFVPQEKNEKVNVNVTNWSLNNVMPPPKTPFYNYKDKSPYPPCNMESTTIVFDKDYASTISSKDLNMIRSVIKGNISPNTASSKKTIEPFVSNMKREGMITYNKNGANSNDNDDSVESMECTEYTDSDESESETASNSKTSNIGIDWSNVMKNPTFIFVLIFIVLLLGLGVLLYVLNIFKKKDLTDATEVVIKTTVAK